MKKPLLLSILLLALFHFPLIAPLIAEDGEDDTFFGLDLDLDLDPYLTYENETEDLYLHLGGYFVLAGVKYGHANARSSGFEFQQARLPFAGRWNSLLWRIEADLIGVDTPYHLFEAWGGFEVSPALRIRAGLFPIALGTEFATPLADSPLVGYSFPSYVDGRYDWGVSLDGDLLPDRLWYQAAATAGWGFDLEGNKKDGSQLSLRMAIHPFGLSETREIKGLFVGAGYAYNFDYDNPIILATPLQSTVFTTPDLDGEDASWLHLEAGYAYGPFRVAWERALGAVNDVPVGSGETVDMDQIGSWAANAVWAITGEEAIWSAGRWLSQDEADQELGRTEWGSYGRWELAARYSNADIDRRFFDYGITNYSLSTQEVRTFTLNLNCYPTRMTRVTLGWVKTIADRESATINSQLPAFGGTNRDSSFVLQLALNF